MKKLLSICVLLALILSSVAFTGAIAETTDNADLFPVMPSNKDFIHNPTTYCNPIFPYFDHRDYRVQEYGWTEGGHPLKYNGKYYLLYSSIGLEFYAYCSHCGGSGMCENCIDGSCWD